MNKARLWWLIIAFIGLSNLAPLRPTAQNYWLYLSAVAIFATVALVALNIGGVLQHNRLMYRMRRSQSAVVCRFVRPFDRPGLLEKLYVHIRPPKWCRKSKDDLMLIYRDQKKLIDHGQVAIAMLVQGNVTLFKKGYEDAPANVVYSDDLRAENLLDRLRAAALKIFEMKGTEPEDPDALKFAKMVSYEYSRGFRITVPDKFAPDLNVTYTTIMVHRKHLPEGYLANEFFPLLIHEESRAAMILPARYWSKELLADWGIVHPSLIETAPSAADRG